MTGRAASTTCSPARTRAYARCPATLIALTELGTCWMSPVSAAIAAAIAGSVTPSGSAVATVSPSASSVLVVAPSRIVAV